VHGDQLTGKLSSLPIPSNSKVTNLPPQLGSVNEGHFGRGNGCPICKSVNYKLKCVYGMAKAVGFQNLIPFLTGGMLTKVSQLFFTVMQAVVYKFILS